MSNIKKNWRWSLLALVSSFVIIFPLYFVIVGGFMSVVEIFHRPPYLFPPNPTFKFYTQAFNTLRVYFKNSLIISLGVLIITLLVSIPASFVLAKFHIFIEKPLSLLLAFMQMLPTAAVIIPLFLIFNSFKLINNQISVILGISIFTVPFSIIVLTSFMRAIPSQLIEAAMIDGAGIFKVFWYIGLPLSRSAIATVSILTFILAWGDFIVSLSFLKESSLQPMSIGLYRFIGQYGVQWNNLMAGSAIFSIIPVIIAIIAGKYLISGLLAGALRE